MTSDLQVALDTLHELISSDGIDVTYDHKKLIDIMVYLFRFCPQDAVLKKLLGNDGTCSKRSMSHSSDVNQLKKLKQSINELYAILDSIPANIYWKATDGRYLGINKSCLSCTPFENKDAIIGKPLSGIYADDSPSNIFDAELADFDIMQLPASYRGEEEGLDEDGKPAVYLSIKQPLYEEEHVVGMVGISIDITQKKLLEKKLVRSNQIKTEFIQNMSHDMRTPITGMLGIIDEIKRDPGSNENIARAKVLGQVTRGILSFSNAVLETIDLESDYIQCKQEVFSLKQVIDENIDRLSASIRLKSIQLTIDYANDYVDVLWGHKVNIDRILLNVFSNAVKFTDKGSVGILIQTEKLPSKHEQGDVQVVIAVSDTGVGISEDKYEYIFEKFSRLSPSYDGKYEGSGLGLYVTKKLLDTIGGSISICSDLNKGTTVTFMVPGQITSKVPITFVSHRYNERTIDRDRVLDILVVEDNVLAMKMVKNSLEEHLNCHVDTVSLGEKAIACVKNNAYDFILMDIGLPDIDGIEVSRLIRSMDHPVKSKVPIIALTGHSDKQLIARCKDSQINRVLLKPIMKQDVFDLFELL
jgi:two-component system, OmpR family, aerobic respiration control sensor histidine kinase ArcB